MGGFERRNARMKNLAWFHHFVCPVLIIFLPLLLAGRFTLIAMGVGSFLFALWRLIGYIYKWTHIYCAIQLAGRKQMTPQCPVWDSVKKSDAFGPPVLFVLLGIALIVCHLIYA